MVGGSAGGDHALGWFESAPTHFSLVASNRGSHTSPGAKEAVTEQKTRSTHDHQAVTQQLSIW